MKDLQHAWRRALRQLYYEGFCQVTKSPNRPVLLPEKAVFSTPINASITRDHLQRQICESIRAEMQRRAVPGVPFICITATLVVVEPVAPADSQICSIDYSYTIYAGAVKLPTTTASLTVELDKMELC